jgi:hypothetical protein
MTRRTDVLTVDVRVSRLTIHPSALILRPCYSAGRSHRLALRFILAQFAVQGTG